ncbi:MAG: hypothetical protein JNM27_12395 [Leptospirales bacterium]|nr:hypothetical protein [Leptospirales bacterium]
MIPNKNAAAFFRHVLQALLLDIYHPVQKGFGKCFDLVKGILFRFEHALYTARLIQVSMKYLRAPVEFLLFASLPTLAGLDSSLLLARPIRDESGRPFEISRNGAVTFDPVDDNWKPVTPVFEDALLHLAEARSLSKRGLHDEAILLWNSISFMATSQPDAPAYIRQASAEAAREIRALATRTDVENALQTMDPYYYYHREKNRTYVGSTIIGFRVSFSGKYRTLRHVIPNNTPDRRQRIVFLGNTERIITIGADAWLTQNPVVDPVSYADYWDRRRRLTQQLKRNTLFKRNPSELNAGICWPAQIVAGRAYKKNCAIFNLEAADGIERQTEYYELQPFKGIFLGFNGQIEPEWVRDSIQSLWIH